MGFQAVTNPWLLAVSPDHREALKETFDMGAGIVTTVVDDIVSGDFYAIGGYVFDVASMFVGVGQVTTALKGTKLVGKLAEGLNAFKAAAKATTISKLGKITNVINKGLKYGDDVAKAFATKLKNIPLPIMDEIALAGGGSVKVIGHGTIDDYIKMIKANFSKGSGADKLLKPDLLDELSKSGVKYNPDDVVMVVKNTEKDLLWLEYGNNKAGLNHIEIRHATDFSKRGIKNIPEFIHDMLKNKPISIVESSRGMNATYLINGKKYLIAYGKNGFIVSVYPI